MYAPVSRQIDAPLHPACPEAGLGGGDAGAACVHPVRHQQASHAQAVTAYPADLGATGIAGSPLAPSSSFALLLLLLLVPALAIAWLSNGRRAAFRR